MVERLPTDRIHKTTTSRIIFIGLAAATMMITVSMIGAIQLQEASAAKPGWCYTPIGGGGQCAPFGSSDPFESRKECEAYRQNNPFPPSDGTRCHVNK
jgi:hypothetical protein